ncbi:metallophosphoesterase [Candidatus Neomarinimicrobiota bacterium]
MIVQSKFLKAPPASILFITLLFFALSHTIATAQSWQWIAYGDTRSRDADHRSVLQSMVNNTPDYKFIINVGDVVDHGDIAAEWDIWQLAVDDVLGGSGWDETPPRYMATPGNHDATETVDGLANWKYYLSGQVDLYGNDGKFFTFDYENARFIIMDSDKSSETGAQYTMLLDAIENNPKTWLFVIWHHPIFDFGPKSYEDSFHDNWGIPLYENGCDAIFMGHAHYYVRSKKLALDGNMHPLLDPDSGIPQIVTGNGGAPPYTVVPDTDGNNYMVEAYTSSPGYTELTVTDDTLYYRHILSDGTIFDDTTYTPNTKPIVSIDDERVGIPKAFSLDQNFPNPFNPATTMQLSLQESGFVSLQIIDLKGKMVRSLIDDYKAAGTYKVSWDGVSTAGIDMPSGIYFSRMSAGSSTQVRKLVLLR